MTGFTYVNPDKIFAPFDPKFESGNFDTANDELTDKLNLPIPVFRIGSELVGLRRAGYQYTLTDEGYSRLNAARKAGNKVPVIIAEEGSDLWDMAKKTDTLRGEQPIVTYGTMAEVLEMHDNEYTKKRETGIAGKIGKTIGGLVGIAAAGYILASGVVAGDYLLRQKKVIAEQSQNDLIIVPIELNIGGKPKKITFVGETHNYNKKESDYAANFVNNFDLVFSEGSETSKTFWTIWTYASMPYDFAEKLAIGRDYNNYGITNYAYRNKIPVKFLEDDTDGGGSLMSSTEKISLIFDSIKDSALAPVHYFGLKPYAGEKTDWQFWRAVSQQPDKRFYLSERNAKMLNALASGIRKADAENILVDVGKAHLPGMIDGFVTMFKEYHPTIKWFSCGLLRMINHVLHKVNKLLWYSSIQNSNIYILVSQINLLGILKLKSVQV